MVQKIKLAVVDDHPVVRRGVCDTFRDEPDFEVVAEGANALDAVTIAEHVRPDLMLLDVSMPGGGVEAMHKIREFRPDLRVAMLSVREDLATVRAALQAGARGYISKGIDGNELVDSVRKMMAGACFVSPELAARLLVLEPASVEPATGNPQTPRRANLTEREDQIFRLLGEGLNNQEISQRLGLSENTVKHYITPLLHKLGVRNRTEAALVANGGDLRSINTYQD
jgi:two-component system, NarL family, nitrate/nitrite response regulator NarL